MGRKRNDITNQKFGKLLVTEKNHRIGKYLYWECKCECGEICLITSTDLKRGRLNVCRNCTEIKSKESSLNLLYENYKRGALKRNLTFELNIEEFKKIITNNCNYCDSEPKQIYHKKGMKHGIIYNGIDRVNNKLGYTLDNCVTACKFCNFAKTQSNLEEFMAWLNNLKKATR